MSDGDAGFRLSRIRAQGAAAARKYVMDDIDVMDAAALAAINPYPETPERDGWIEGFLKTMGSKRAKW